MKTRQYGHKGRQIDQRNKKKKNVQKSTHKDFLGGLVAKLCAPNAEGQGSIPGQGTRSHMLQLKISHVTTKMEDPMYLN